MLQSIRDRSQSWIAKIIIGAVIVTMALFGVESLIGLFGQSGDEVATVNGEPINRQQVELNVQRAMRSNQVPADQERALRGAQRRHQSSRQRVHSQRRSSSPRRQS